MRQIYANIDIYRQKTGFLIKIIKQFWDIHVTFTKNGVNIINLYAKVKVKFGKPELQRI